MTNRDWTPLGYNHHSPNQASVSSSLDNRVPVVAYHFSIFCVTNSLCRPYVFAEKRSIMYSVTSINFDNGELASENSRFTLRDRTKMASS